MKASIGWKHLIQTRSFAVMKVLMPNPDYKSNVVRPGVIAMKCGMTSTFDKWGVKIALSVVQLENNQVIKIRKEEKDGINSVVVGSGLAKIKNSMASNLSDCLKAGTMPKRHFKEFKVSKECIQELEKLPSGVRINANHFIPGQFVDVRGVSIGKGFQGVMKLHGFKGLPASHGVSVSHRSPGGIGAAQDPGKVWKGKKMAGRMGNKSVYVKNLKVHSVDAAKNLVFLEGHLPGKNGNMIEMKDALEKFHSYKGYENKYHLKNADNYYKSIRETLKIALPFPTDLTPPEEVAKLPLVTRPDSIENPLQVFN